MTKIEALGALLDMAERKVAIYDAVSDPKQRRLLKQQITVLVWAAVSVRLLHTATPEMRKRVNALERRFPL